MFYLFLKLGWVIISMEMRCFSNKLNPKLSPDSTVIGTPCMKIIQQSPNFPLSNLRSPLYAHTNKFPIMKAKWFLLVEFYFGATYKGRGHLVYTNQIFLP